MAWKFLTKQNPEKSFQFRLNIFEKKIIWFKRSIKIT